VYTPDRPFWFLKGKEKMEQNITKDASMDLLTIPEACKRLRIGHWNIYEHIRSNTLKTVKIGKRRFIREGALNDFIMAREQ
jgi:excisionase family DNA binding protein